MALSFKQGLTAVFGHPVAENPTQVMAEAAYAHHNLNWRYLTVEVLPEDLPAAVAGARAMGFAGFNLTIPHKVAVIPHLDGLGESAEVIGAVNCVVRRGERLIGENTDGRGFLESLREVIDPSGAKVTMIGAGGAARAIAVELALAGAASVTIINRSEKRGKELVEYLQDRLDCEITRAPWSDSIAVPAETDVLINATSIGLYPDVSECPPLDFESLSPTTVVADVVPNPPRTLFLRSAEERGFRTIDGLGMLINQGRTGIEYWTGVDPDPTVMRKALENVFAE